MQRLHHLQRHHRRLRLFIPEQYVTHTSVNHRVEAGAINRGYRAIGTIHSHCDFSAFHSGTDKHDMGKMPGLHITIGHVNRDDPEFVFALSVGDAQFDVTREQIIDEERPLDKNGYDTAPDRWLGFVHTGHAPWANGITTSFNKPIQHPYTPIPSRMPYRDWNDFEWDDGDYKRHTAFPKKSWNKQDRVQQQLLNIEAFEQFADYVQDSERILEEETAELAYIGFVLNYNITFNPERAKGWLKAHHLDIPDDDEIEAEYKLLPEGAMTDAD